MCIWYLVLYNNQIDILKIIMKLLPCIMKYKGKKQFNWLFFRFELQQQNLIFSIFETTKTLSDW